MSRLSFGTVFVAIALMLGSAPTDALAKKKPKSALIKKAKVHYNNARDHHEHKEYLAAAAEYEKAFSIHPNPDYIFNAAQAHRLAGNAQVALDYYNKYLELDPEGRGAADARAQRAKLTAKIAKVQRLEKEKAEAARERDVETPADGSKATRPTKDTIAEETVKASPKEERQLVSEPAVKDGGSRGLRIAGLATFGVGVVALGFGIKFGLDAKSLESDVEANTAWNQGDFDDGEAAEKNSFILYGVGAAALVAGGVMYAMGTGGSGGPAEQSRVTVIPVPTPSGGGLLLRGRF